MGQFIIYGVSMPWLLLTSILSYLTVRGISYVMARKGYYRFIWHPPLFDVALFFIVLGCYFSLISKYGF